MSGRRSLSNHEEERFNTLQTMETIMAKTFPGEDGHSCLLRTLCEAAETPFHMDGFLGEAINMLLIPSHILERIPAFGEADYVTAQRNGQSGYGCHDYYKACPQTFFKVRQVVLLS